MIKKNPCELCENKDKCNFINMNYCEYLNNWIKDCDGSF